MKISIIRQSGKKMKVIAFLQARTDSTRLPKKVLKVILDKPMIIHQLMRTKKSKLIDELVLLTSNEKSDDELANLVTNNGFKVFRGDKDNVLKRFYHSAESMCLNDDDIIVRLTGDCPLHDAKIIDESIEAFINANCDYLANCFVPVYPDGLDVEVFNCKTLNIAYNNATKKSQLEHVTPYIRESGQFLVKNLEKVEFFSNLRLTVDEESDFFLIKEIYEHFQKTDFSLSDVIFLLNNNQTLLNFNNKITRNEGYIKSLKEDNDN